MNMLQQINQPRFTRQAQHRHCCVSSIRSTRALNIRASAVATSSAHTIITGDIGGTNARLGLWKCDGSSNVEVYSEVYPTTEFPTFEECLQAFLDEPEVRGSAVEAAALAVAGAVENNRCPMTNTNWVIDGRSIQQQFKFQTQGASPASSACPLRVTY
jgi:hypothetical protein